MKTKLLVILSLLLSVSLFVASCDFVIKEPVKPTIAVNISQNLLDAIEQRRPREIAVYEVIPNDPETWLNEFRSLSRIGEQSEAEETADLLRVTESARYLEVRKASNSVFFGDMEHLWTKAPTPEQRQFAIPSNEEAEQIALDWLGRFGFARAEAEALEISVSDELFEITQVGRTDEQIAVVVGKNVEVRRRVDDLFVYGPGSKIKFYIGEGGEVNGYLVVWRQILPSSTVMGHRTVAGEARTTLVEPIDVNEAVTRLRANPLDHLPLAMVTRIDIDAIDFGYYARSAVEEQRYLQPVYVFQGTVSTKAPNGEEIGVPYEQYVVALQEPVESIWPETRSFEAPERQATDRPVPEGSEDIDEEGGSGE